MRFRGLRDDMVAGQDFLDGNGSTNPDLPNVIFGDHGVIKQYVDDPNLPPVLLQKIQTTNLSTVLEIKSVELQNGADDVLYGSDIPDILIGGSGHDMIDGREADDLIFGDNVNLTRRGLAKSVFDTLTARLPLKSAAGSLSEDDTRAVSASLEE